MDTDDIPSIFYCFETKKPFDRCIECDKFLLDEGIEYLIEKAIRSYKGFAAQDVIFDYAMCMNCAENMKKSISAHSWQAMIQYFQQNIDINDRMRMIEQSVEENLAQCMIKKKKINECDEYQLFAHCIGNKISRSNPPYLLSSEVMEELLPILSNETINEMNGFFKKHFSPDPSFFEPSPRLILV